MLIPSGYPQELDAFEGPFFPCSYCNPALFISYDGTFFMTIENDATKNWLLGSSISQPLAWLAAALVHCCRPVRTPTAVLLVFTCNIVEDIKLET